MRVVFSVVVLALALLACTETVPTLATSTPPPGTPIVPTVTEVSQTVGTLPTHPKEVCVQSVGLWLRNTPEIANGNKVLALPQGTKALALSGGTWSRVYLKSYDLYGYVKTSYLGDCK